jgi:hypothetical protein
MFNDFQVTDSLGNVTTQRLNTLFKTSHNDKITENLTTVTISVTQGQTGKR